MSENIPGWRFYVELPDPEIYAEDLRAVLLDFAASHGISIGMGEVAGPTHGLQELGDLYNIEYITLREDSETGNFLAVTTTEDLKKSTTEIFGEPSRPYWVAEKILEKLYRSEDFRPYLLIDQGGNTVGLFTDNIPWLLSALKNRKFLPIGINETSIAVIEEYWKLATNPIAIEQ
jgi:hypothetical protein